MAQKKRKQKQQGRTLARQQRVQLNLRVDPEVKADLQGAAARAGMPLREFVINAALEAASELVPGAAEKLGDPWIVVAATGEEPPKIRSERGETELTARLRNLCRAAARGGAHGWAKVGYELASQAKSYPPPDIDAQNWYREILELESTLRCKQRWATLEWFNRHYPSVLREVPERQRFKFVQGAQSAQDEDTVRTLPPDDAVGREMRRRLDAEAEKLWGDE